MVRILLLCVLILPVIGIRLVHGLEYLRSLPIRHFWLLQRVFVRRLFLCVLNSNITVRYAADNQRLMAEEGGIECLISLLSSTNELIQRQSAKALANLGVNGNVASQVVLPCSSVVQLTYFQQ